MENGLEGPTTWMWNVRRLLRNPILAFTGQVGKRCFAGSSIARRLREKTIQRGGPPYLHKVLWKKSLPPGTGKLSEILHRRRRRNYLMKATTGEEMSRRVPGKGRRSLLREKAAQRLAKKIRKKTRAPLYCGTYNLLSNLGERKNPCHGRGKQPPLRGTVGYIGPTTRRKGKILT